MVPDPDGDARCLLREAGYDDDDAPSGVALAKRLGLKVRELSGPLLDHGDACVLPLLGVWYLFVRPGLSPRRLHYACCHEVAEWHLIRSGYDGEDVERLADAIAESLAAPRRALRAELKRHGEDWPRIARRLRSSETLVLLRYGSVTDVRVAALTPSGVVRRGDSGPSLPPDRSLWELAREASPVARPGLRRVVPSDASAFAVFYRAVP